MSLTFEIATKLVDRGEFGELRRLAQPYLDSSFPLDARLSILVAHALVYTGESRRAMSLVGPLDLESRKGDFSRSKVRLVLGLANRSTGCMSRALIEFQRALRVAQESGTQEEAAWAQLYLFRHMIDSNPVDLAPAMLPTVRAAVTKAGSPDTSAFLHICVAVLEGHNGRLNEAFRHNDIARRLIALHPNAWLDCGNQLNRAAILLAGCRFAEAMRVLESLRLDAAKHGLSHEMAQADANLGHLYAMVGDSERALATLARVVSSSGTPRLAALSASEGMAQAYLKQGDLLKCGEMLDRLDAAAAEDSVLASAYAVRWAAITRARLDLERGEPTKALAHIDHVQKRYQGVADLPFAASMSLVTLQSLTSVGRTRDAALELVRADRLGITGYRQLQSQFYGVVASALASGAPELAVTLSRRGVDVGEEQGIVMARPIESTSKSEAPITPRDDGRSVANTLASLIDVAYNPRLLYRELAATIELLKCSPGIRSVVVPKDSSVEPPDRAESLCLGSLDSHWWYLECESPSGLSDALVLADVLRVGRAAVALEQLKAAERNRTALWPAQTVSEQDGALFLSDEMRELFETASRVARTDVSVLITGETGTGKEVLARLIHSKSPRSSRPFVPFNCTTVPKEMMDSQLFGHRRGAFTGASEPFQGVIRSARGGTLLLDEIGDLGLECQPKLLRFLESGEVLPLGEATPVHVDVRVIAATNAHLETDVSDGRFREDLYYRLNIVRLRVPPLRERRTEIPSLCRHYLQKFAEQFDKGELRLAEETMEYLVLFKWPGNIRQLANEMRRLAALAERGAVLMPEHLSSDICSFRRTVPSAAPVAADNHVVVRLDQPLAAAVQHIERAMLAFAMRRWGGKVEAVAKALGLSRKGLYLKRQRYGLDDQALR